MTTRVKICGITCVEDALAAADAGADLLGLNFWPRSKRHVSMQRAAEIADRIEDGGYDVELVGVFVNQSLIEIASVSREVGLDSIQLHGDEPASVVTAVQQPVIKAIALADAGDLDRLADIPCSRVLVDTPDPGYGGSGRTGNWELAQQAVQSGKEIFLAGGLTADNVAAAIDAASPFAVDVASGVEAAPGKKDRQQVVRFIRAAKGQR